MGSACFCSSDDREQAGTELTRHGIDRLLTRDPLHCHNLVWFQAEREHSYRSMLSSRRQSYPLGVEAAAAAMLFKVAL